VRILVVTGIFPPSPDSFRGNFVLDQAIALRDRGCDVSVAVVHAMAIPGSARDKSTRIEAPAFERLGLRVQEFSYFNLPRNQLGVAAAPAVYAQVVNRLKKIAAAARTEIIHAHNEQTGYVGVRLARSMGLKSGVTIHGINSPWMFDTERKRRQLGWTLENAGAVFFVGPSIASHFKGYVRSSNNFRVVPNGHRVPDNVVPSRRIPRRANWRVVGVGNLGETKGYQFLIQAIAEIERVRPGLTELVIVGDGVYGPGLRRLIDKLAVGHIVHMTGELKHAEALNEVAAADIFCLPSFNEAFGLVYVEAMALGRLAIGCRTQGPEAFISDGINGFLVEPRSCESVKETLLKAFDSGDFDTMREAGRVYAAKHLGWEHNAERVLACYSELMGGAG
jgi:glycosyltransferase involved in cell wall biosynthesis